MIKNIILGLFVLVLTMSNSFSQSRNFLNISPCDDTLCYDAGISVSVAGNSFNPISYLWSNGSTNSSINVTSSGTYTVTVTGYLGNSNQLRQVTKSKTLIVLNKPEINNITPSWVCTFDTVKLGVDAGYTNYSWNNGSTDIVFSRQMTGAGNGFPELDTVSVWYTAFINNICQVNSDTVVIRGIRRPNGVGSFYDGRTDLTSNDSVPAGLVLTYVYAPQYEMEFTKESDPNYVVTYITPVGERMAPLNILDSGHNYFVRTRPIINGVDYCWGINSYIGILPDNENTNYLRTNNEFINTEKKFYFYSTDGKLLLVKNGIEFNDEWLKGLENKIIFVLEEGSQNRHMKTSIIIE